ncbi:MAG TPA: hypothetical protein VJG66_03095 [Patescibacteria group bacterium]|nr:hypothetical protein [Patescibacteria group bacterium]
MSRIDDESRLPNSSGYRIVRDGQETLLKPILQGVGMAGGAIVVRELGGNLLDMIYVGVFPGFIIGTAAAEIAVRIRRSIIAKN